MNGYSQIKTWQYSIDNDEDMVINDLLETQNETILFAGKSGDFETFQYDGFLLKLSKSGAFIDNLNYLKQDTSTNIVNVLNTDYSDTLYNLNISFKYNGSSGFILANTDTTFNMANEKVYSLPANDIAITSSLINGNDGDLIVGGSFKNTQLHYYLFIYKLSAMFDSLAAKYFINNTPSIILGGIHELNDQSFWLIDGTSPYYWHIDSCLNLISSQAGHVPHYLTGNYGFKWDSDTSFYLAGDYTFDISRVTDHDIGFTHQFSPFDSTGNVFNWWGSVDTLDFPAYFGALDYKNKDSIFIGGSKNLQYGNILFGTIPSWYVLLQTDSMLNIRWERFYGGDACYNMTKLIATNDGGCIMAGTRFDYKAHPNIHERDIYIIKVNSQGLITSVNGKPASIAHDAIVYPNPGSNFLKVRVAVQHRRSMFKLFDMAGRLVLAQNIEGKTAQINTTLLKTGTYVYTITNNNGLNEKGKWVKR